MTALLTNDDGIDAPGLALLARVLSDRMPTVTMAPDRHLSGCGHQVTTERPLRVTPHGPDRNALDGTPADCTRVGLHQLDCKVKWVFSGVNEGGNLGVDTYMSGTVAAVREAAMWGVPAVAFSQYRRGRGDIDWDRTGRMLDKALDWILKQQHESGTFWNINFPDSPEIQEPELVECPMDPHPVDVRFEVEGSEYSYRGIYQQRRRLRGSDVDRCFSGQISITRIGISGHDHPRHETGEGPDFRPLCDS